MKNNLYIKFYKIIQISSIERFELIQTIIMTISRFENKTHNKFSQGSTKRFFETSSKDFKWIHALFKPKNCRLILSYPQNHRRGISGVLDRNNQPEQEDLYGTRHQNYCAKFAPQIMFGLWGGGADAAHNPIICRTLCRHYTRVGM